MVLSDGLIQGGITLLVVGAGYISVGKYFIKQTNERLKTVEDFNRHTPPCKELLVITGEIKTDIAVIKEKVEFIGEYIKNGGGK